MRKTLVTIAAAMAVVAAGSLVPDRAQATGLTVGIGSGFGEVDIATRVHYDCPRVWRCGPFGCDFRSACGWNGYGHTYNAYRPWRHEGYDRPYWGRPHWNRW
jgi:hypothetical protein